MKDSILCELAAKWESRANAKSSDPVTRDILDKQKGFIEGTLVCAIELRSLINLLGDDK